MIVSGVSALPYDDSAGFTAPPAFGPLRVLHQIGSGVLGPVFRAFDARQARLVAVKAFRLDVVPETSAALAEALRRLAGSPIASPHVVPVVDAGLEGMTPYLATEYDTAETFDVALRRLAPAPLDRALPILQQIAAAIEAAWAGGRGHGALHPRDVFVSEDLGVRVGGFGVIAALESVGIRPTARRPYAAPERLAGGAWDIRADVYSLGVLAHELLTGRRPGGVGEQDGALPTGTTPEQRVAIRRALAGVFADNPAERYATPSEFLREMGGGAEGAEGAQGAQGAQGAEELPLVVVPPRVERSVWSPPPVVVDVEPERRVSVAVVGAVCLLVGLALGAWLRGVVVPVDEALSETTVVVEDVVPEAAPTASGTPAPAEAPATRGRLLVRSVPAGARVVIAGRVRGTTPATIRDLPFGTYNVTVTHDGYQPRIARVTMSRSVPARDITVELRPVVREAASASVGSIYLDSRPAGAQVRVNGRLIGTTPMRMPDVAPGSHTIQFDLEGHRSVTTTVAVRPGQQTPVRVSLEVM